MVLMRMVFSRDLLEHSLAEVIFSLRGSYEDEAVGPDLAPLAVEAAVRSPVPPSGKNFHF